MNRLRSHLAFLLAALAVATTVPAATAAAERLTRDQFLSALTRDLTAHFRLEGELQLELLRPWVSPEKTASSWDLVILEYPAAATSSMLVRCREMADGAPAADLTIVVRATLWRDAWAARQPLPLGTAFDPSVLDTRRVDFFRERDVLPATAGDRTYEITRAVSAGRLLTWHDVARRPLVRKGDTVEVSASHGQLLVTLKGLAMENGAQGDIVTIRNPDSRKDFSAVVVDENHVQVHF